MKNIKDITLLAFAVIGFYTIITAFSSTESNQPQQVVNGTPESHVWELGFAEFQGVGNWAHPFAINKVTGEVRKYNQRMTTYNKKKTQVISGDAYVVMKEKIFNK